MKLFNSLYIIALTVIVGLVITACEDDDDFERYIPQEVALSDTTLIYNDIISYPVLAAISSDSPAFAYEGAVAFVLDTVREISGATLQNNRFTIDRASGIVSYENEGELLPGTYLMNVGVTTGNGLVIFEDAVSMQILDVPISVSVDNAIVEAAALQTGTIATVSYTDDSGGDVTSVTYGFVEVNDAFQIDENTGEITKIGSAPAGSISLSIRVTSNLGIKNFDNVVTVNVGEAPTLTYFQADGVTDLTNVSLSPWTAYTTSAPALEGMEAGGGFAVILPDTLTSFASAFSFDAEGRLSVSEGAGLHEGVYSIGVTATNSGGVSADFENLFTFTIEAVWETVNFIDDNFDDSQAFVAPGVAYPGVWDSYTFGGSTGGLWQKVFQSAAGAWSGIRRNNPWTYDEGLVRTIDLTGVYAIRISFGELMGYGAAFIENYNRALYAGDDITNAAGGSFVDADWTPVLDTDDTAWQGINWNTGLGPANVYNNIEVDLSEISGNTLYLMWRLFPTATASGTQNGQWLMDYFTAQRVAVTDAVEE